MNSQAKEYVFLTDTIFCFCLYDHSSHAANLVRKVKNIGTSLSNMIFLHDHNSLLRQVLCKLLALLDEYFYDGFLCVLFLSLS